MSAIRRFCCDDETGETLTYHVNDETGEPCLERNSSYVYVPKEASGAAFIQTKKPIRFPKGYNTKSKKFQSLKASIIAGSHPVSHRMLLIPTVMIFPALICVILMILEIYLHVRCHKKNKSLKDPSLYYRSPFHIVTSNFCGVCRESDTACKVGQLQDKRRYRYDYIRGIAL